MEIIFTKHMEVQIFKWCYIILYSLNIKKFTIIFFFERQK